MFVLLWPVIALTWVVVLRGYARNTPVLVATAGFLIYSIPALCGWSMSVSIGEAVSRPVPVSPSGTLAIALAWLGYLITLLLGWWRASAPSAHLPGPQWVSSEVVSDFDRSAPWAAALFSLSLFGYMMAVHGVTFFLVARAELSGMIGFEYLLWRWANVVGLLVSMHARARSFVFLFIAMIAINVIIGDRTMVVIALVSAFCYTYTDRNLGQIVGSRNFLTFILIGVVAIFFAKPLYVLAKGGEGVSSLASVIQNPLFYLGSFEPFATQHVLDRIIAYGVQVEPEIVLRGVLAQMLVIPSAFGVDSASYSVQVASEIFNSRVTYGLAASFWGQGYSIAGLAGVFFYGVVFGVLVLAASALANSRVGSLKVLGIVLVSLTGVYIYRNSIENYAAFIRQIVLVFLLLAAGTSILNYSWAKRRVPSSGAERG